MIEYMLCLVLFGVGIYALLAKRNIIKMVIGVSILGYALNMLLLMIGHVEDTGIPIIEHAAGASPMANPLPQALVLATVTIGLVITIMLAVIALRLFDKYKTLDMSEIRNLKG